MLTTCEIASSTNDSEPRWLTIPRLWSAYNSRTRIEKKWCLVMIATFALEVSTTPTYYAKILTQNLLHVRVGCQGNSFTMSNDVHNLCA